MRYDSDMSLPVHVAIPHYNAPELLLPLVSALVEDDFTSITVLDDHSTDQRVLEEVKNTLPNVDIVFGEQNRGAGGNRNRVLELGKTGIVWFLDCDTELVTTDNAQTIRSLFEENPHQLVGGTILNKDGTPMSWNYGHEMHPKRDAEFRRLVKEHDQGGLEQRDWDYPWLEKAMVDTVRSVDWVAEGSFVLNLDDFSRIGGYDEAFRYHEGQDLARRLRDIGVHAVVIPTIVTRHLEADVRGATRKDEMEQSAAYFYEKFAIDKWES